jgi:hypothetical protein
VPSGSIAPGDVVDAVLGENHRAGMSIERVDAGTAVGPDSHFRVIYDIAMTLKLRR